MTAIDHFFVFCRSGAPERRALLDLGLAIDAEREHAGQGTRNVCFAFADCYLELLWVHDERAARDPMVKPLGLHERMHWREHRASPFGVCLRDTVEGEHAPFATWDYRPKYVEGGPPIRMACNSGVIGEPLLFQVARPAAPTPTAHLLSQHSLHRLVVTTPDPAPMSLLHELKFERLELRDGERHRMEVELAAQPQHELDLGQRDPALPLVLRW